MIPHVRKGRFKRTNVVHLQIDAKNNCFLGGATTFFQHMQTFSGSFETARYTSFAGIFVHSVPYGWP